MDLFRCYKNLILKNSEKKKTFTEVANCSVENLHNVLGELYKRIFVPFYIPIIILVALLLILPSKESLNFFKFKIFIFIFGLFVIIFSETTIRFIDSSIISNIKILVIPLFFMLILYIIVLYKFNLKYRKL